MLISLPTHQLASSPSYKFVNLPNLSACQSINSPSPHLANSSTYKLISLPPHQLDISPSRKFINLQARQLTNPSIHHLPTSQTRQLANSSTKNLKSIIFYFTKPLWFYRHSSENIGCKLGKLALFSAFRISHSVYF